MKLYAESSGCDSNKADTSMIMKYFANNEVKIVGEPKDADMIVYMSCGFNQAAINNNIKRIKELRKQSNAKLYVGGCLPAIDSNIKALTDGTFTPRSIEKFVEEFKFNNSILNQSPYFDRGGRRIIRVSTGCEGSCSYCVIKKANGRTNSRPFTDIVKDIKDSLDEGIKDFLLVSEDVGAWGQDLGGDNKLTNLVNNIFAATSKFYPDFELIRPDFNISLSTISPEWIKEYPESYIRMFDEPRVDKTLYLAFQSGSDKILKSMNRKYTAETFSKIVDLLNKRYDDMKIISDVIAGFPGETEEDFQKSLDLIANTDLAYLQVFKYTDMQGTIASKLPDKVDEEEKIERAMRAIKLFIDKKGGEGVGNIINTNLTREEMDPYIEK